MTNIAAKINAIMKQEVCALGDVLPNKVAMAKNDIHMETQQLQRIAAAKRELPNCEYRAVRVGRIGVEHRLYRNKTQWTDAESHKTGSARTWFEQRDDGVYSVVGE